MVVHSVQLLLPPTFWHSEMLILDKPNSEMLTSGSSLNIIRKEEFIPQFSAPKFYQVAITCNSVKHLAWQAKQKQFFIKSEQFCVCEWVPVRQATVTCWILEAAEGTYTETGEGGGSAVFWTQLSNIGGLAFLFFFNSGMTTTKHLKCRSGSWRHTHFSLGTFASHIFLPQKQ